MLFIFNSLWTEKKGYLANILTRILQFYNDCTKADDIKISIQSIIHFISRGFDMKKANLYLQTARNSIVLNINFYI